jgi:hypothetical protein
VRAIRADDNHSLCPGAERFGKRAFQSRAEIPVALGKAAPTGLEPCLNLVRGIVRREPELHLRHVAQSFEQCFDEVPVGNTRCLGADPLRQPAFCVTRPRSLHENDELFTLHSRGDLNLPDGTNSFKAFGGWNRESQGWMQDSDALKIPLANPKWPA